VKASQDWKIFPNPANGVLTLKQADNQLGTNDLLDWKIVDARGKEMSRGRIRFEGSQSEVPIPIELAGGQYFITLTNGTEQVMTQSFIVAR
ncbi:MAG: T9SS type A sorting domain-containing protein, partial [Candidatus Kapabacteria bacterium]|nr:T9SS type A sorting domain-containing protein [Candidatus Kapabacteria bacterium]